MAFSSPAWQTFARRVYPNVQSRHIYNEVNALLLAIDDKGKSSHVNIAYILSAGVRRWAGQVDYFFDMELYDTTLEDYYFSSGRPACSSWFLSWPIDGKRTFFIVGLMQQLLNGLYFLAQCGKVHRDLKPANGTWL
jgi:serine/threonine protein kinase